MKSKRMFMNLFVIDFPLTAITSIMHRITGLILFLSIPFILYFLKLSVDSETSFELAKSLFSNIYVKICFFTFYLSFLYHLVNGIKHIIIDFGFFDSKESSKKLSIVSLFFIFILFFLSILI